MKIYAVKRGVLEVTWAFGGEIGFPCISSIGLLKSYFFIEIYLQFLN